MEQRIKKRIGRLETEAASGGYTLNPDGEFVRDLVEGLLVNLDRYGMESCPCRLFEGKAEDNVDIVCPCVYRDDDLAEYGACFCALYVAKGAQPKQVPDRRADKKQSKASEPTDAPKPDKLTLPYPVYRCSVCGYLCANNYPPHVCPICKATKERFERFL